MADAIINSGLPSADANPIQISRAGGLMQLLCSECDASLGARSCRRSSLESREARESRWILRLLRYCQRSC